MSYKWDYITEEEREVVFKCLEVYKSPEFDSKNKKEKKDVLIKLFGFYNQYVSQQYSGSFTCGDCVSEVIIFFNKYYKQWQIKDQ